MRAAETTDIGDAGQAMAAAAFADFGWPATPTTAAQDLGTDLLIAARDRRFHRGEYVGAQVKSGTSNLDEPIREGNKHVGWWVRVTPRHAAYWLDNALPHILVLYDHTTKRCHWVHLTNNSVIQTGLGRKVRVPAVQVVHATQIEALLAVAASARGAVPLEGTAWTGAAPKGPTDHLRYALVAPRLIAPHPNSGLMPATEAEVIALLMQARVDDVWTRSRHIDDVPSLEEARDHGVWAWRFAAASADWLLTDEVRRQPRPG